MWRYRLIPTLVLFLPILPVITLPGFAVNRFIAPRQVELETIETEGGSSVPQPEDAPPGDTGIEKASPLVCLGFRPGQLKAFGGLDRLVGGRNMVCGHIGSCGACLQGVGRFRGRLERLLAEARCVAGWMAVNAPPIRPNAPPGAAECCERA